MAQAQATRLRDWLNQFDEQAERTLVRRLRRLGSAPNVAGGSGAGGSEWPAAECSGAVYDSAAQSADEEGGYAPPRAPEPASRAVSAAAPAAT